MPLGERAEGHGGDDDVGDDPGCGLGDEVEGDPADRGEGGEGEPVLLVDSEPIHREEHEDRGGPVEPVVGEEEIVDALRHVGRVGE